MLLRSRRRGAAGRRGRGAAPTGYSDRFTTTEASLATVEDGSVRPLSGRHLIRLAEGSMGFWAQIFDLDPTSFGGSVF